MKLSKLVSVVVCVAYCFFNTMSVYAQQDKQMLERNNVTPKNIAPAAMKFNNFVYIFLGPGLDPKKDRSVIKNDALTFTAIGIDFQHKDQVIAVAKEAMANGAQMIELCGGFGPMWIAKVSEAIKSQAPVGGVFYGPEARRPLLDLLSKK